MDKFGNLFWGTAIDKWLSGTFYIVLCPGVLQWLKFEISRMNSNIMRKAFLSFVLGTYMA
jgi:uncharacterized membrane protein YcfT